MAQCEALRAQASDLRKQISSMKPLGARLDGCRAALERARNRQRNSHDLLAKANSAHNQACEETRRLESELAELEHQLRSEQQRSEEANSIAQLQAQMAVVVSEMANSQNVSQDEVNATRAAMDQLFAGLVAIQTVACTRSQSAAPAPVAAQRPSVLQMLQRPQVPPQPPLTSQPPTQAASQTPVVEMLVMHAQGSEQDSLMVMPVQGSEQEFLMEAGDQQL